MSNIREYAISNKRFVVAHRGSSGTAPENTMSAFEDALNTGVKMLEIDIHVTTDDKVIVLHDISHLQLHHDIEFKNNEFSYDDIKGLDIGSWFDTKFSFERIPLLSDVLDFVKGRGFLNIEIKSHDEQNFYKKVNTILDVVRKTQSEDEILFASFDYKALKEIKRIDSRFPTAAVRLPDDTRMPSDIARLINCEAFIFSLDELSDEYCSNAIQNNLYTGVYAVDSIVELHTSLDFEVAAIGTNFPELIIAELRRLRLI